MLTEWVSSVTVSIVVSIEAGGRGGGVIAVDLGSGLWPSAPGPRLPRHRLAFGGSGLTLNFFSVLVGLGVESEKEGDGVFLERCSC